MKQITLSSPVLRRRRVPNEFIGVDEKNIDAKTVRGWKQ
jgi:hypothetical protein